MKTPTIIVRLGGLYLLTTCTVGLLQLNKAQAMVAQFGVNQNQMVGDMQLYLWIGLVVGLAATVFAGPLARILAFDADAREPSVDFTDRLMRRK